MTIHFHVGRVPIVLCIGDEPVAPMLRELQEKDEVLLLTGLRFPAEGELARYIMRRWAGGGR
jgi:hypothetical protein